MTCAKALTFDGLSIPHVSGVQHEFSFPLEYTVVVQLALFSTTWLSVNNSQGSHICDEVWRVYLAVAESRFNWRGGEYDGKLSFSSYNRPLNSSSANLTFDCWYQYSTMTKASSRQFACDRDDPTRVVVQKGFLPLPSPF